MFILDSIRRFVLFLGALFGDVMYATRLQFLQIEVRDRNSTDAMVDRLEKDISERQSFIEGTTANAQDADRDLTENELQLITEARSRIENAEQQLEVLGSAIETGRRARERTSQLQRAYQDMRRETDNGPVEYRSAGSYIADTYAASLGSRDAAERLEVFHRTAAHQKTADNLGVVPDPIQGSVINFIDAARPVVSFIGPQPITSQKWYRPKVTQHTSVGTQGSAGAASDEKAELDSQKMLITRLDATAVTYGGYVNVSRQNIDFSEPQVLDLVINDLAAQYAIQTEAATGAELLATSTSAVTYIEGSATDLASAIWEAAATVYAAVKGQGRLAIAVAADTLGQFGPLFNPVNPQSAQSPGFTAGAFGQGVMGSISGIPVLMSAGIGAGEAYLFSTAALEVFERRVGNLQAIEPSVLGVQVAYAGYFTPLTIDVGGIVPLAVAS
jgi:HK97 family phage major capsid protein